MGTTLQHGIFLPAEGEMNCYAGLASNWTILDGVVGGYSSHAANTTIHVTAEDKTKWNAVTNKADASALTAHTGDTAIHVTAADKEAWNGKADASALTAHTGNTTIHVTAEDKQAWNGKADASALTAHTGNTTIHVTAADKEAWNGKADASALTAHTGDTTIHVTAEDKAKWDAVTSKADDSDVVHKSGNETISGNKTFSSINGVEPSSLGMPDLNKGIDISSYITVVANANKESLYTPPANGWVCVRLSKRSGQLGVLLIQGGMASSGKNIEVESGVTTADAMLPVVGGVQVSINSALADSVVSAYFYPCLGNV